MGKTKRPSLKLNRATRRPTVAVGEVDRSRMQELALAAFDANLRRPLELETLVFMMLRRLEVTPRNYVAMHKTARAHVLANFAVEAGEHLRLVDVSMRRITVLWTTEDE